MSKRQYLSILGIIVIIFLFLGFPPKWDKTIAVISGLLIVLVSYNLPYEKKENSDENI